ncbi:MAG: MBL fold metallo-hydrolase [Acidimicrobiia bacterium]|nr:MBL fold metallo-hydrolase [Acidimicrobiia bacterium]
MTSGLELTVLGCSGSYPGPGRACSGYLIRSATTTIVVDMGPGTVANLQAHVDPASVDAVVLSHEHPDHWVDLTSLRVLLRYGLGRSGLAVYGTAGTRDMAEHVCGSVAPTFEWTTIADGDRHTIGDLSLRFAATDHYVPTLAVRVTSGACTLAYSADTGPGWSFAHLGGDIDLALCEATTLVDGEGDGVLHLSARQAGALARAGGAARLVLTHLLPTVDVAEAQREAEESFGAPVEVASDGATFVL